MEKVLSPKDIADEIHNCDECPYLVDYTDYEDSPQHVRYCAIMVTRGKIARYWHGSPDTEKCPLRKM